MQLIEEQRPTIAARAGLELDVVAIAVADLAKDRGLPVDPAIYTDNAQAIADDPDVDVIVELIGGVELPRQLVLASLSAGKTVVTGNKALLAEHGPELYAAADAAGVDLLFEAAVAGGIPIMRSLRQSLIGEPIKRVMGIVNGTTNYILSQMTETGAAYGDALAEAQALGYAEADPTADVEGHDAAAKAAIIATVAFGAVVEAADVSAEGISSVTADDIAYVTRLNRIIKLLAIAEQVGIADSGAPIVAVRVHPAILPCNHPLASVRDSFNAVFVEGDAVDDLMLYGRGAGGRPTASAVLGDIIDGAANRARGIHNSLGRLVDAVMQPSSELESAYYINLEVTDEPGVLAEVAGVFGVNKVSIQSMEQEGMGGEARLVFITHRAVERDVTATLEALRSLAAVRRVGTVLRVVGSEEES